MQKNWSDATLRVYTDFDLQIEGVEVIDFNKCFPHHSNLADKIIQKYNKGPKGPVIGRKTVKFSYKAFCIANELQNNDSGMTVWADGDTQAIKKINIDFNELLENKFLACQLEKSNNNNPHIESGILFFNSDKEITKEFGKILEHWYNSDKLFTIKKPYDGYVIAKILRQNNLEFVDLNKGFNVIDKRSHKDDTFLHPILNENFIHWIGKVKK